MPISFPEKDKTLKCLYTHFLNIVFERTHKAGCNFLPKGEKRAKAHSQCYNQPCKLVQTLSKNKRQFQNIPPEKFLRPPRCGRGCSFGDTPLYLFPVHQFVSAIMIYSFRNVKEIFYDFIFTHSQLSLLLFYMCW